MHTCRGICLVHLLHPGAEPERVQGVTGLFGLSWTRHCARVNAPHPRGLLILQLTESYSIYSFISTGIRFGNGLCLTAEEIHPLKEIINKANDHMIFVNDFYSYEKEKHAMVEENACILNAVHYLDTVLSSGSSLAKEITMLLILDCEARMEDSLRRLETEAGLTRPQLRYAHAMVEAAAGNLLFSVTSVRYARGHEMKEGN